MRLSQSHTSGPGLWSRDQDWAAAGTAGAKQARKKIVEFPLTGNGNILFPWDHSPKLRREENFSIFHLLVAAPARRERFE